VEGWEGGRGGGNGATLSRTEGEGPASLSGRRDRAVTKASLGKTLRSKILHHCSSKPAYVTLKLCSISGKGPSSSDVEVIRFLVNSGFEVVLTNWHIREPRRRRHNARQF